MEITAAWCVSFDRPGLRNFFARRKLKYAYRAPCFFLSKMREAGHHAVRDLVFDEELTDADFSVRHIHESAQIFYLTTHGTFSPSGYHASLYWNDWYPSKTGIGGRNTVVAIFDTCFLIDSALPWRAIWARANFGARLRLILGFDNFAAIDGGHTRRGLAFADNLSRGDTFVDAWFKAVASTTPEPYNKAIAIGIGDDQPGAVSVLTTASLSRMPGPRTGSSPFFELRP
jgi:hypothetical protein